MNHRILFTLLLLACLTFSCKKEKKIDQGTIEFDADGVHHSFIPKSAGMYDDHGLKRLDINSPTTGFFYMALHVSDDSIPNSIFLRTIEYPDTCRYCYFILQYSDTSCQYENQGDTAGYARMQVTSCTGGPPVLNGTFEARYTWGRGGDPSCFHEKLITNGKITNVTYQWND